MSHNRARVLVDAVAVDAWHDPFRTDGSTTGVHVELSFREGRLGGKDKEFPFTFKLAVKRAQLTVKVEAPLAIERKTIARSIPKNEAEKTTILDLRERAKASLSASGKVSPATLHLALSGEVKAEEDVSTQDKVKIVQTIPRTIVTPYPVDSASYSWDLIPGYSDLLEGQPWDPDEEPRFKVRVAGPIGPIEPTISVKVSCAIEDVSIWDLVPKKNGLGDTISHAIWGDISKAAAIQYLKRVLRDADLEMSSMDNRFAEFLIADVLAREA